MKTTQRRMRKTAGMTIPSVMMFMTGASLVGLAVMGGSMASNKTSDRSNYKSQANLLAESAVQKLYDNIRDEMRVDGGGYTYVMARENVSVATINGEMVTGWHEATILDVKETTEDVDTGSGRVRRTSFLFTIEGKAESKYSIQATVRAKFSAIRDFDLISIEEAVRTGEGADMIYYPAGAIVANNRINLRTNNGVKVYSPDGKTGHVIANQGISWDMKTGSKSSVMSANALDIQGLMVTTTRAKAWTEASSGVGNTNGTKNYRTPAFSDFGLSVAANEILAVDEKVSFASPGEVDAWETKWRTLTQKPGARYFNAINSAMITANPFTNFKVLLTPAYINGDLEINPGDTVYVAPSSSNPAKNVLFVSGDIKNKGTFVNFGTTIAMSGKYTDTPASQYKLDTIGGPFGTDIRKTLQTSILMSTKVDPQAISIKSDVSGTTGVVYAAKGGLELAGSGVFRGLFLSGGLLDKGNVEIKPTNGGTFTVYYEPDGAGAGDYTPTESTRIDTRYVPGSIVRPFTPTKLREWNRIK